MPWPILLVILLGSSLDPSVLTVPVAEAAPLTVPDLKVIATRVAQEHKLNVDHFLATIQCESGWDANSKGDYPDGKVGFVKKELAPSWSEPTSFGLVQLHNPSRDWGISTSTAYDPVSSIEIMADAWGKGKASLWSCWNNLYGNKNSSK